jgi:hypothetical protein
MAEEVLGAGEVNEGLKVALGVTEKLAKMGLTAKEK